MKKCPSELELEAFIGGGVDGDAEQKPGHVSQFDAGVMFQAGGGDLSAFSFADSVSGKQRMLIAVVSIKVRALRVCIGFCDFRFW